MNPDDLRKRHHYVPPRAGRCVSAGGWVIDRPLRTPADITLDVAILELEERLQHPRLWDALVLWIRR